MKRTLFPLLLAAVGGFFLRSAVASTPSVDPLTFTGRITTAGTPLPDAARTVHVTLRSGTTNVCETVVGTEPSVTFKDGRFSVPLPACAATQVGLHGDLEIQLEVTGAGTFPWTRLGAVPYALEAKHTQAADEAAALVVGSALEQRVAALEQGHVTRITFPQQATDGCRSNYNNSDNASPPLPCIRQCEAACVTAGYVSGYFNGTFYQYLPGNPDQFGCTCVR